MNKFFWFLLFALIPVLLSAAELSLTAAQLANAHLVTTTVTARQIQPRLTLSGTLTTDRRKSHRVAPVVDGMVIELNAVEHEPVRKAQVLARLRSNSLGQAQADYLESLARFDLARAERTRIQGLWKDGVVAESRWLTADSEYKRAHATLEARRRLLSLTGLSDQQIQLLAQKPDRLAEFALISPRDGIITGVEIEAGQMLTAGQPAFHVDDISTLWAEVQVPVASLPRLALGAQAIIKAQATPDREYHGSLQALGGEVEKQNQTLGGRIVVDNRDGQLRPGMFVTALLNAKPETGLMIPAGAVFKIGDQAYLFKALGNRRFVPVAIQTGTEAEGWIPLRSGVAIGTEIVSGGVAELKSYWQYQGEK